MTRGRVVEIVFLGLLFVGSVLANISLRTLIREAAPPSKATHMMAGMLAPELQVETSTGVSKLDFSTPRLDTVLYVLAPGCPWCEKNAANMAALTEQVRGRFEVVAVSLDNKGLSEFMARHRPPFPVYLPTESSISAFMFRSLPELLVIDRGGIVLAGWRGAFGGKKAKEIEQFLHVSLPGIGDSSGPFQP